MKSPAFLLTAALGLAISGTVVAQDPNQGPRHRGRPGAALRARMLERFATDGTRRVLGRPPLRSIFAPNRPIVEKC
jgi:hypothetical protein